MPPFDQCWKHFLGEATVDCWQRKAADLYDRRQDVHPRQANDVFRAFNECPLARLKVVIVGQAPYDNAPADGLAFSVPDGVPVPPSLWIMFSEICHDLRIPVQHTNGNLERWARQGILLLNSSLTLTEGQPGENVDWDSFIDHVVERISRRVPAGPGHIGPTASGIVFMLWGNEAKERERRIVNGSNDHLVLTSSHPAPRSAFRTSKPFVGCRHFSEANAWLARQGSVPVFWH